MSPRFPMLVAAILAIAPAVHAKTTTVSLKVERAWARPAPAGIPSSAAYFVVRNTGTAPDVLEGVSSPAATASLHESMSQGGMMTMAASGPITVPPGGVVEFKPGGRHVMLERLKRPLTVGQRLPLTLTFKHAGRLTVTADVRPTAP